MEVLALTLVLLLAYFASIVFARITGLSVIVGFLLAGIGLGLVLLDITNLRANIELLAEIGVAFLLFEVGSHLPLKKLIGSWKQFFISGPAQLLCTCIILYFTLIVLGLEDSEAQILAFALSLSSTAVVMQLFKENGETGSPASERAISILVFQDIAAILGISILLSLEAGTNAQSSPLTNVIVLLGLLALVLMVGLLVVRPFFNLVVALKSPEILTPSALLFVLVLAWGSHKLGLSYALGAFLGGVSIAGTRYAALVKTEIQPFRALLLALFFISVGLSIDPDFLMHNIGTVLALTLGLMILKSIGNFIALKITAKTDEPSIYIAGVLSQGSEFAFVIALMAVPSNLLSAATSQMLQAVVSLSLVIAPFFAALGCYFARSCSIPNNLPVPENDPAEVIITEFDEVGRQLANALQRAGILYRGHDRDLERLAYASSRGYKVFFSDLDRPLTLSKASMGHAKAVVSLIEDEFLSSSLIDGLKKHAPDVPIYAATKNLGLFEKLSSSGLTAAFIKNKQTARLIFSELTSRFGSSKSEIEKKMTDWTWSEEDLAQA